jgi:DNA-binding SARP family transcriptional activator
MRLQSTTRDPGEPAPDPPRAPEASREAREVGLPGSGRLDSYRLLARKAARHADAPKRLASDENLRMQLRIAKRALGGYAATAARRADPPVSTVIKPHWAAQVEIRCFGRFQVSRDGVTVEHWRRRTAERLLKFLLVHGRRAHRDVLLDVLWPDVPSESSVRGLRVTLHALRHAVAATGFENALLELVKADGDTYVLNTDGVWIDVDAFSDHYYAGLRYERQHQTDAAVREFAAAEALYRDDFLVEDLYEEWTVLRREELKDQYLLVLTKLSQLCLVGRDLEGCIARSHRLLAKEPCREDAYQRLMQCFSLLGQRGRALRWYEICAHTLRQELDVGPSAETQRLYLKITAASP